MNARTQFPAWADQRDHCQWVDREPVYSKQIGGHVIDPSEYVNEKGAVIMTRETPCRNVVDRDERYCPRHKLIMEATHANSR
jgi:hypothetical protein